MTKKGKNYGLKSYRSHAIYWVSCNTTIPGCMLSKHIYYSMLEHY